MTETKVVCHSLLVMLLAVVAGCQQTSRKNAGELNVLEMECSLHVITDRVIDPQHPHFNKETLLATGLAEYSLTFQRRSDRSAQERRLDVGATLSIGEHTVRAQEQLERSVTLEWRQNDKIVGRARSGAHSDFDGKSREPSDIELEMTPVLDGHTSSSNRAWVNCSNRVAPEGE